MACVLIATEDFQAYRVLGAECEAEGHEAVWAVDGMDALEQTLGRGPDLVLLDPRLATFSGYELCEILRADPKVPGGLPIFLLTDDEVNPHVLMRIQASGVFPKTHGAHEVREFLSGQLTHADRLARMREAL